MTTEFRHHDLWDKVKPGTVVDRYVRGIGTVYEHTISLSTITTQEGYIEVIVALDLLANDGDLLCSHILESYPPTKWHEAEYEAVKMGDYLHLAVRAAHAVAGWQQLYDPELGLSFSDVPPPSQE